MADDSDSQFAFLASLLHLSKLNIWILGSKQCNEVYHDQLHRR